MIQVYFETESYAEVVALFNDSELYNACVPILEKIAKERGFDIVTESVIHEESLESLTAGLE